MNEIGDYNRSHQETENSICKLLMREINAYLPEARSKLWRGSPVWFLDDTPVVGYSVQRKGVQLLFWSGTSLDDPALSPVGKRKAAEAVYESPEQIDQHALKVWLLKAKKIQLDCKNIVQNSDVMFRLG